MCITNCKTLKWISPNLGLRMKQQKGITRTAAALVIIVIIVVAGAGIYYYGTGTGSSPSSSSSSSSTSSPVTIQFYEALAPSEASYFTSKIIPQFESANPGITVNLDNLPSATDVANAVEASVNGGSPGTTLVGIDNLVVGELISANVLQDLSSQLSAIEPTGLISSAQKMVAYEQNVYSATYFIPFRSNVPLTFYSTQALSAAGISSPPSTTAQLMSDAQALQSAGYSGPIMMQGSGRDASAPTELYQWIVQFGGNPFMLNDTGSVQTFQYLYNLSAYFNPDYTNGYWGSYVGLANGQYQLLDYQWPYVYNLLTNSTLGMTTSTLGVYPGPAGPANSNHVLGGDVLVVPKGASNMNAIVKFANFLLGAKAQQETLITQSWVAVNSAAYQNLPANYSAVGTALQQAISEGVFLRNPAPWISQWNTIATNAWTSIVINHASYSQIQSILNNANKQMYQYLVTNYGAATAQQYEQNVFKPISVS
jgi:trehalose transport system substrate-binding protein